MPFIIHFGWGLGVGDKVGFVKRKDHARQWSLFVVEVAFSHHRGYPRVRTDITKANLALTIVN